jgi:hypothetical protein
MKAKAGKQEASKRRAAVMADVRETKWPVLLDQLAIVKQDKT